MQTSKKIAGIRFASQKVSTTNFRGTFFAYLKIKLTVTCRRSYSTVWKAVKDNSQEIWLKYSYLPVWKPLKY